MNSQRKVLVVEDCPETERFIRATLDAAGFETTCVSEADHGFRTAGRLKPDVVLIEMMLDDTTGGLHLAYRLQHDDRLKHVPIVIVSAPPQRHGIDLASALGSDYLPVTHFLDKPLTSDGLLAAVRQAVGNH